MQEYFPTELSRTHLLPFWSLLRELKARGANLIPVSLPATQYALSAYYVIASAEASSCLARYDGIQYGQSKFSDLVDCAEPETRSAHGNASWR
jgi:aspartyl-tRNA(Asn)/glutamyl-tRNA(Gln) amidotransferase subunit A